MQRYKRDRGRGRVAIESGKQHSLDERAAAGGQAQYQGASPKQALAPHSRRRASCASARGGDGRWPGPKRVGLPLVGLPPLAGLLSPGLLSPLPLPLLRSPHPTRLSAPCCSR